MSVLIKPAMLIARCFGLALAASFALALVLYAGFLVAATVIAVRPAGDVAERQARALRHLASIPDTAAVAAIPAPDAGS